MITFFSGRRLLALVLSLCSFLSAISEAAADEPSPWQKSYGRRTQSNEQNNVSPSDLMKSPSTQVNELLDQYERAVDLGLIDPANVQNNETNTNNTSYDTNSLPLQEDPIASIIKESVEAALAALGDDSKRSIVIENEISGNEYTIEDINGLEFSPVIEVTNDMSGGLHDNNNAESESGDVKRQNGVADFTDALKDNNNAYSESGTVVRQNGIIAGGDSLKTSQTPGNATQAPGNAIPAPTPEWNASLSADLNSVSTNLSSSDSSPDHDTNIGDKEEKKDNVPTITIRNKIKDNKVTMRRKNGLIVTPVVAVHNDMSNALYNNNNAKSVSGNVQRQNGVADFTGALQHNNGAFSQTGDVYRQNGIIGGDASLLRLEAIESVFQYLRETETVGDNVVSLVQEVIKLGVEDVSVIADILNSLPGIDGSVISDLISDNDDGSRRRRRYLRGTTTERLLGSSSSCGQGSLLHNAMDSFTSNFFG